MLRLLAKSFAIDVLANAVVIALLNVALATFFFLAWVICGLLSAAAPAISIALLAATIGLLIAATGPIGHFLARFSRHEDVGEFREVAYLWRNLRRALVIAFGGLGAGSALMLLILVTPAPGPVGVAATVLAGWAMVVTAQITLFAIAAAQSDIPLQKAARSAAALVIARPVYCAGVLAGFLLCAASLVILLPGPAAGMLLVHRAAANMGIPYRGRPAEDDARLNREERLLAGQSLLSALFPWKA